MILSIILFVVIISLGLGFLVYRLLHLNGDEPVSSLFISMALGLALFVLLSSVLGLIGWINPLVYVAIAVVPVLAYYLMRGLGCEFGIRFELPKPDKHWWIVICLFFAALLVFETGAFAGPLLEDDDSWQHAAAVRYVMETGSYLQPAGSDLIHYLAPYPPFYDVLMAVLADGGQASINEVLKFFNAFLAALVIPLFYCWVGNRLDKNTALWATFILALLPCFMSHFIWAQTLAMVFVFPVFYFIDKFNAGRKPVDGIAGIICLAALLITQPSVAGIVFIMICIYQIPLILSNTTGALAIPVLSLMFAFLIFWGGMLYLYGIEGVLQHIGFGSVVAGNGDTSNGIVYGISDFLTTPFASRMDQPTGIGEAAIILCLIGTYASLDKRTNRILLAWLVFCLLGVEANAFPIKMMPHRFWVFLSIPVAILGGIGISYILEYKKDTKIVQWLMMLLIISGLLITSGAAKYVVETSIWPSGVGIISANQFIGYQQLKQLPVNTKVFSYCDSEDLMNGIGLYGNSWLVGVADYKRQSINDTLDGNLQFLHRYNYSYLVIDDTCVTMFAGADIQNKISAIESDKHFVKQDNLSNNRFLVYEVTE